MRQAEDGSIGPDIIDRRARDGDTQERDPFGKPNRMLRKCLPYVGGHTNDIAQCKVRVNCEVQPWDAKIEYPRSTISNSRKTVLIKMYKSTCCKYFE